MSKHTPGPWMVAPRIARYQVIPATNDERSKLASINALEFEALSVGTPNGQMALIPLDESNRENANLIAAAPDLLEALESLADDYLRKDGLGFDLLASTKMFAAIRKAKGESQ